MPSPPPAATDADTTNKPAASTAAPAPGAAPAATGVGSKGSTYIIAPGRTIDGKLPGDEVTLSDADAERFRDFGFILADDGSRVVPTGGPAVNVEDGVQIKPA